MALLGLDDAGDVGADDGEGLIARVEREHGAVARPHLGRAVVGSELAQDVLELEEAVGDLVAVEVRFHDHGGGYFAASGANLVGRTTVSPLRAGQLIPVDALPAKVSVPTRLVTVPVAKLHMPHDNDLRGRQVDLYVTLEATTAGDGAKAPQLVLANVTVADTVNDSSLGGSNGSAVVLEVPVAYVDSVVGAIESGSIDLVQVPSDEVAGTPSPGVFLPPPVAAASASADGSTAAGGST